MLHEYTVACLADIDDPGALEFETGKGDWPFRGVIVRWNGEVHAYANICPHAGHPLNLEPAGFFTADRQQLICSSHGAVFNPESGQCTGGPCVGQQLHRLSCRLQGDAVLVRAPESLRGFKPG